MIYNNKKRYKRNGELETFLREFQIIVLNKYMKEKYLSDNKVKYFQINNLILLII